jgi:hypothetical protein
VCTPHGLPVASALTGANAVDREVLAELLAAEPDLVARRPRQLLRPARKGEPYGLESII